MNSSETPRVAPHAIDRWRPPRRLLTIVAAAVLLLSLLPLTAAASAAATRNVKPAIVLVHGAWADPSGWNQVVSRLHDDGYRTVTPTLDMQSIDGDAATVRAALDGIAGSKLLVGHSYGGVVISNAAAGRSDVLGLVFTAAFVPDQGESILSLGQGFKPPAPLAHLAFTGEFFNSPAFIAPPFFRPTFAQDVPVNQANAMNAAQRPINAPILGTPSGPVAWHDLPSWYAVSGADLVIDPAEQRFMAARAKATTIEFPTASHVGGFTVNASAFTKLIEQAVKATG